MRARSRLWIGLIGVVVVGTLVAIYGFMPSVAHRGSNDPRVYSSLRGLLTGMTIYAQNNQDAFPPPDQTSALLVKSGIVERGLFDSPPGAPGEPAFYAIVTAPPNTKWSNSFRVTVPLIYAHPAFLGGSRVVVLWSDDHVEEVAASQVDALVKSVGGRVEPVK